MAAETGIEEAPNPPSTPASPTMPVPTPWSHSGFFSSGMDNDPDPEGIFFWMDDLNVGEEVRSKERRGIRGTSAENMRWLEAGKPRSVSDIGSADTGSLEGKMHPGPSALSQSFRHSTGSRSNRSFFLPTATERDEARSCRSRVRRFINSSWTEAAVGSIILFNFVLICMETDSRAAVPGASTLPRPSPPAWIVNAQVACFSVFVAELLVRMYAEYRKFHTKMWNLLDTFIIIVGCVEYICTLSGYDLAGVGLIRVVRLCRLLRLARVMRLFTILKELRRLLQMMGSCFKTLFWSFLLLVLLMTMWAIIAVEIINPVVQEIADKGGDWDSCDRCRRSFSSVWHANITIFQTVVAGDSWGKMAIPVIEEEPLTAIVFVGALLTLVFGVLNLIVAVIVDTFAENREKDIFALASDLEAEEKEQKRMLGNIFKKIDADRSGSLSYEELLAGASRVAEFASWLRVMDIDAADLEQLFNIVDEDGNGAIEPEEFIEAMYRMKTADSRTATKFVKHIVTRLDEKQGHLEDDLSRVLNQMPSLYKMDESVQDRLAQHERQIQETIELALYKASEVALEAAMQSAVDTAANVMGSVSGRHSIGRSQHPSAPPSSPAGLQSNILNALSGSHPLTSNPVSLHRSVKRANSNASLRGFSPPLRVANSHSAPSDPSASCSSTGSRSRFAAFSARSNSPPRPAPLRAPSALSQGEKRKDRSGSEPYVVTVTSKASHLSCG